jgi:hypothetical protein
VLHRPVLDPVALRSLTAVADCVGIHRAARAPALSQSAVSRHVRKLEKMLGRPVVEARGAARASPPTAPDGLTACAELPPTPIPMSALVRSGADPATVAAAFEAVRDLLREDTPAGA